jgi:hypothetical protein
VQPHDLAPPAHAVVASGLSPLVEILRASSLLIEQNASRRPNGWVWVMTSGIGLSRQRLQPL